MLQCCLDQLYVLVSILQNSGYTHIFFTGVIKTMYIQLFGNMKKNIYMHNLD